MLKATLAILNAKIITLHSKQPKAEAIAICEEKIVAVGSNSEIRKYIGKQTRMINAKKRTVIPGLIDSHVHMTGFGWSLQSLDLKKANSIKTLQRKLRIYADKNRGTPWIVGGRWNQEKFIEKRYPTRLDLDAVVADRPVFLVRVCGHLGVANSKALKLAGIARKTIIDGGQIDLDEESHEPNGILRENAIELIWKVIPKPRPKALENACLSACKKAVEAGITGVHWLIDSAEEICAIQKLLSDGKLPLRVYLGVSAEHLNNLASIGLQSGFGNDMLKIGFVKLFADGSLGARTAALNEPYSDDPRTSGMLLNSQAKLNKLVLKAHQAGLQLGIHAIGDKAIESVLEAFSKALEKFLRKNHRHRIEHCSVLNPKLIRRMKQLGVIASVQPHFIVSDFWAADRLGEARTRWTYPFKTLVGEGLIVASGSDCPVEPINPLVGIWAAVARKTFTEERLSIVEALRTYTVNGAYASFDEDKKGTIEVGKLADLTVLSDDLSTITPDEIGKLTVEMTIVNGKIVYCSNNIM